MTTNTFVKHNVGYNEYFIHQWTISLLKNLSKKKDTNINIHIPKILTYDPIKKILTMQKIHGDNLSNIYGENIETVPIKLIQIIRQLLDLLNQYLIDYIDITGYNFMLDKNENLWILDFEHAKCRNENDMTNPFLLEFINGKLLWNPEFN
jgi:tRNA A-37 threonylcarbamoyl transferase component Bud32